MTQGDSLQTETGLGSSGFVPIVCASFSGGCPGYTTGGGSISYPPGVNVDSQALGGTDCGQAYSNYTGGTDLNPPGIPAMSFYNGKRKSNLMTIQCGVNDYIHGNTAATAYTGITNLVAAAKAKGYKVIVATLTDSCHISQGGGEASFRGALNSLITGGALANGYTVADYAANGNIGCDGCSLNATYFQTPEGGCTTGGVHLTAAGVAIQASIMEAAMSSIGFPN